MKKLLLLAMVVGLLVVIPLTVCAQYKYSYEQRAVEQLLENNIGKTPDFLIKIWGEPNLVNRSSVAGVKREQIIWNKDFGAGTSAAGNFIMDIYLYTENGIITSWQTSPRRNR